ncbi:MAG TPA: hypothetical protein VG184_08590 [Acidimicrobiales bacterium]|nr:hypothetical protein [Acidimicrobiales bacterium]
MSAHAAVTTPAAAPGPALIVVGRTIPVVLPTRGDPRLKLSAVIVTIQVLGQTLLGFKVSIAQILVSVALGAVVEAAVILRAQQVLVWPASGILTGNSVALLLRASGTRHGDWWSLHGIGFSCWPCALPWPPSTLSAPPAATCSTPPTWAWCGRCWS